MKTVTSADGTAIAYERTGSGPPLVLVHGTLVNHTSWEPSRPRFEDHFTVYAMDRRGLGESGDNDEYALEREAEDVGAVAESIDEPVVLLGHSYGALISLEAAFRTDNLRTLVLYEPLFQVGAQKLYSEDLLAEMKALHEAGENERLIVLFFEDILKLPPAEIDALRSDPIWQDFLDGARTVYRETQAENEYEFDPARFAELTTPTILVSGSESSEDFTNATDGLDDALPNSRIVTLDGQGHDGALSAPDLFVDEVHAAISESD
ncbi:alpha/beta hydrolase [Natronococcus sp. A-GB1]|uniref:alpha/beta fold hydrolase n=1 Tax=Natronococcus sp. A-GB1 TaxID=3037648 RepID=UPI00241E4EB0|nr:alpha/beta hydrolase [Natronococcus sp. A-GB1]MDG5758872.1 alpha/beta hydrolase [Natronococcus sp. A-GB1]